MAAAVIQKRGWWKTLRFDWRLSHPIIF